MQHSKAERIAIMDTSGTPITVSWRGAAYQVTWGLQDGQPLVDVSPESLEFREACLRNMRTYGNHLTISFDTQGQFLADDEAKGR